MDFKTGDNLNDHYLVEKVLRGDTNAFSAIIKATEGLVAQIVFKMISSEEERKDIAQDVYMKAFNKLDGFKFQSKLSTWIGQIAYNSCLSYLEKKKLVLLGNSDTAGDTVEEGLELLVSKSSYSSHGEAEKSIFQKELSAILLSEIEKLSPVYKTMITLYHNEDLSYEEISQITALPGGTVKSHLFRARKALKESILAKYKKEEL
ncbi:MAG TPA: sigma-70 family RNA polymerase sigma factor [Puia sp.]|nr:sigma-70 family RNA polymerase sigma factor [Puia sp.]